MRPCFLYPSLKYKSINYFIFILFYLSKSSYIYYNIYCLFYYCLGYLTLTNLNTLQALRASVAERGEGDKGNNFSVSSPTSVHNVRNFLRKSSFVYDCMLYDSCHNMNQLPRLLSLPVCLSIKVSKLRKSREWFYFCKKRYKTVEWGGGA